MDRLVRQGRHLIEMGRQSGLFFDIQQEGVFHPFDHGLGRSQALPFQRRGAAVAEEMHPLQGPGLGAEYQVLARQKPRLGRVMQRRSAPGRRRNQRRFAVFPQA